MKERLCKSLIIFLTTCIPGMAKVVSPDFHHEIAQRLLNLRLTKFNVVAPRGHAKSSLVGVAFVLWHIFLENTYRKLEGLPLRRDEQGKLEPFYVLLIGKTQGDAIKRLRSIKYVLGDTKSHKQSRVFKMIFGEWGQRTAIKWSEDIVILKDGTVIQCVGTGQNVHGLNEASLRLTLIVVDDPENEENTKTVDRMQANIRWLFQAIVPSLDPRVGRLIVIGTPINTQCMAVSLHKSFSSDGADDSDSLWFQNDLATGTSTWSVSTEGVLLVPGDELEESSQGYMRRRQGLLWEQWIDAKRLSQERARAMETPGVGLGVYYRMWECVVVGDEEQIFIPSMFNNTWKGTLERDVFNRPYLRVTCRRGLVLAEPELIPVCVTTGVDPAFSTSSTADRTAIANVATDADDNRYEIKGVYKKLHPHQLLDAIEDNHRMVSPDRGLMEANGPQEYVAEDLHKEKGIRYIKDKPRQRKKGVGSRIASLQPPMEQGKWFFLEGSPIISELTSYPRGRDDYADATEKANRVRMRPEHEVELDPYKVVSVAALYYDPMLA